MSASQKPSKPTSRWNFLQQAVASVESRLDTILGDEEDLPQKPRPPPTTPKRASSDFSRSDSGSQQNDRLQERLARAMAKKSGSRPESPAAVGAAISRTPTPLVTAETIPATVTSQERDEESKSFQTEQDQQRQERQPQMDLSSDSEPQPRDSTSPELDIPVKEDLKYKELESQSETPVSRADQPSVNSPSSTSKADYLMTFPGLSPQKIAGLPETAQQVDSLQIMQEEINGYIERIDTLQAKIFYLTKEVTEAARKQAASSERGSIERKLSEKDEKIALLMEEGQKLSKNEMKYLAIIKKLRNQLTSITKEQNDLRLRAEKAERALLAVEDRAKRAENAAKRAEDQLIASKESSRDFEAIIKERDALIATVAEMKVQIVKANNQAEQAEERARSDLLSKEKQRSEQLQNDLATARVEQELSDEKFRKEIKDLKAALEQEKAHSRAVETEMLGEQAILESKLESFRARAEEASSSDHGHGQAKLLRQIETLQTQYASASQNWQGIEGTLLARIANLEKERDETAAREAEARKKVRDLNLKSKQREREIEDLHTRTQSLDRQLFEAQDETQQAIRKSQQLTDELKQVRHDLQEQRVQSEKDLTRRIEEEKSKWAAVSSVAQIDSPSQQGRKAPGLDFGQFIHPTTLDRPHSRRSSTMPGFALDSNAPLRQSSTSSIRGFSNGTLPETPSIVTSADDEFFANVPPTPASQTCATSNRGVNDIISTSTVGAGPSVQLVERMSANVRRLESEKAVSKDEIARLTTQRDEARQEVVSLMREVEQKRHVDERLKKLEQEHRSLIERHQTTLELLGEKSELVEELKADVADVKQMYRELVDTMGK